MIEERKTLTVWCNGTEQQFWSNGNRQSAPRSPMATNGNTALQVATPRPPPPPLAPQPTQRPLPAAPGPAAALPRLPPAIPCRPTPEGEGCRRVVLQTHVKPRWRRLGKRLGSRRRLQNRCSRSWSWKDTIGVTLLFWWLRWGGGDASPSSAGLMLWYCTSACCPSLASVTRTFLTDAHSSLLFSVKEHTRPPGAGGYWPLVVSRPPPAGGYCPFCRLTTNSTWPLAAATD